MGMSMATGPEVACLDQSHLQLQLRFEVEDCKTGLKSNSDSVGMDVDLNELDQT